MVRYLLLAIILGALGGWIALRAGGNPTFTEGLVGQPVDLIPGQGPDNPVDEILERLLFRSLFSYDRDGKIVADLAASYRVSKDGRVYTVLLGDSSWLDGRPVTSADIAFTFTRDPAFAEAVIEQEGEKEIRFVLKNPLASFLDILTRPIAPAHFRELTPELLGNREFFISRVKQEGEVVKEMTLRSHEEARIRNLRFKFYSTEEDLRAAARLGEVDALSSSQFSDPSFESYQSPDFGQYFALFFNLDSQNGLIRNKKFRRAAARKSPLPEEGTRVRGPFSGTWAQANLAFPKFSSKPAGKFRGSITITVAKSGSLPDLAQALARSWEEELGVAVKVRVISLSSVDGVLKRRNFEAVILGQTVGRSPDRYGLWHSSAKKFPGQNVSGYSDPRADRALEEGRRVLSLSERKRHYLNFQRLFLEDNPAIFLFHPNFYYAVSRKFSGVDLEKAFGPEDLFWNFGEWKLAFKTFQ